MPDPLRSIHVAAGVISDARGRILLTRRTERSDLPGLWEFPGGKLEPGESTEQALVRELREELGIEAEVGERLIEVPQRYPDKRLRLEVRRVVAFSGQPRGREGQPLMWVPRERLERYSMPPADRPVVGALCLPAQCRRLRPSEPAALLDAIDQALADGAEMLVLDLAGERAVRQALIRRIWTRFGRRRARWLLRDDLVLARALAIGAVLSPAALAAAHAARPLPAGQLLGAWCTQASELARAQVLGADFAVLAPASSAPDWAAFERLREDVALPLYLSACGDLALASVRDHGVQGVALGFDAG